MERARFRSLDVFRGMAICLMIIVNTPGAGSEPWPVLDHADWFGFTAADIVFPSFLFAVGNAMAFGNLKEAYQIVDRQGIRVLRDPYTAKPYIKFYTTKRTGGGLVNFEAIKLMKFATS